MGGVSARSSVESGTRVLQEPTSRPARSRIPVAWQGGHSLLIARRGRLDTRAHKHLREFRHPTGGGKTRAARDEWFEARLTNQALGEYKGYPIGLDDLPLELRRLQ